MNTQDRWEWRRSDLLAVGLLLAVGGGLALFMLSPSVAYAVAGAWVASIATVLGVAAGCLLSIKALIGRHDPDRSGYRNIGLAIAFLTATAASPQVGAETVGVVTRLVEAVYIHTPEVLETLPTRSSASGASDGRGQVVADLYLCVAGGNCQGEDARPRRAGAAAWAWFIGVFLFGVLVARGISEARANFVEELRDEQDRLIGGAPQQADHPASPTKSKLRTGLLSYPTWIALLIYTAILVPATYLAIGSLLHLRIDSISPIAADMALELDRTEAAALQTLAPVPDLNFDLMINQARSWNEQRTEIERSAAERTLRSRASAADEPTEAAPPQPWGRRVGTVAEIGRSINERLVTGRTQYEAESLAAVQELRRTRDGADVADFCAMVSAHYQTAIQSYRAEARPCLQALQSLQRRLNDRGAFIPPARVSTELNPDQQAAVADVAFRLSDAELACDKERPDFPRVLRPELDRVSALPTECSGPDCMLQFGSRFGQGLYGWLAGATDATILIAGLVGFGLFGAAIRMMGRVDQVTVTPDALEEAQAAAQQAAVKLNESRDRLDAAQNEVRTAQEQAGAVELELASASREASSARQASTALAPATLTGLQQATEDAEDRSRAAGQELARARIKLPTVQDAYAKALTTADQTNEFYQGLKRKQLSERSSLIIKRISATTNKPEFVVSGAAARVFVQGLGAAFTVFLAGQALGRLVAEGGRVSVYSLLLSCFVGAVFAEEIWVWAKRYLPRDDRVLGAGSPVTASPPNAAIQRPLRTGQG